MRDYRYFIRKLYKPTVDVIVLELCDTLGRPVFDFRPGQYVMISYRGSDGIIKEKHAFSIASSPTDRSHLTLGIKIGGRFTQGLARLKEGDRIFVSGPYGKFVFNEKKHHDLVLLAGGIGITPFLSTMKYATDRKLPNKLSLIYSNRTAQGSIFYHEIKALEERNPNLRSLFSITEEKLPVSIDGVINGRINSEVIREFVGQTPGKTFFICGPAKFMNAMKANLILLGADKLQVELEEFSMTAGASVRLVVKNISYAMGFSGILMLALFYTIFNSHQSASASTKNGKLPFFGFPFGSVDLNNISREAYTQLLAKQGIDPNKIAEAKTEDLIVIGPAERQLLSVNEAQADTGQPQDSATGDEISYIDKGVDDKIPAGAKVAVADQAGVNKSASPKSVPAKPAIAKSQVVQTPVNTQNKPATPPAPAPTTASSIPAEPAVTTVAPTTAVPATVTTTAPAPTTASSIPAEPAATTPTPAPTAATQPATVSTTAPAPTTAASAPTSTVTQPATTGATPTTVTSKSKTTRSDTTKRRSHDDDKEDD